MGGELRPEVAALAPFRTVGGWGGAVVAGAGAAEPDRITVDGPAEMVCEDARMGALRRVDEIDDSLVGELARERVEVEGELGGGVVAPGRWGGDGGVEVGARPRLNKVGGGGPPRS